MEFAHWSLESAALAAMHFGKKSQTPKNKRQRNSIRPAVGLLYLSFGFYLESVHWPLESAALAAMHSRVEKPHQGIESVVGRRDGESAQRIGEERMPDLIALFAPAGVGGAFA